MRTVISKSTKKKMTSNNQYPIGVDGRMEEQLRKKANAKTEMVVYKNKLSNGKFISQTRHERAL